MLENFDIDLLLQLLAVDSPSGDENRMADWLVGWISTNIRSAKIVRLRDCLIITKGDRPGVALFSHIDTVGFTLGYDYDVFEIGTPDFDDGLKLRAIGERELEYTLKVSGKGRIKLLSNELAPGSRLVSAAEPRIEDGWIQSPYLDNRCGVWASLQALRSCDQIAVAFTTGEEIAGGGAGLCAKYLWDHHAISSAIVADITWDTRHVYCGDGVALSMRDQTIPSRRFVDRVVKLARLSGINHQIEIESAGASDGVGIERCGCPIDWMFVGVPEQHPHSDHERIFLNDLQTMVQMLSYIVKELTMSPD